MSFKEQRFQYRFALSKKVHSLGYAGTGMAEFMSFVQCTFFFIDYPFLHQPQKKVLFHGYAGTSGAEFMSHIVADSIVLPPELASVGFAGTYICVAECCSVLQCVAVCCGLSS